MKKFVHAALLTIVFLLATPSGVSGNTLRVHTDENLELQSPANEVERELRHRGRNRRSKGGKGGKSGSSSLSFGDRGFLPLRIEPIPFENCIPLSAGRKGKSGKSGSKSGRDGGKGGKGGRNSKRMRRYMSRKLIQEPESLQGETSQGERDLRGKGKSRGRGRGRNMQNPNNRNQMTRNRPLPYCPDTAPTFFPTYFPTFTPFPTSTPIPTATPFPTWTPFPSFGDGFPAPPGTAPAPGTPGTPGAPGPAPAPGAPGPAPDDTGTDTDAGTGGTPGRGIEPQTANVPDGAQNIIVESTLEYGFFPEATPRQPTDEEILGLLEQTSAFYEEVVRAVYPTVIGFQATYVTDEFRPENTDLPIFIEFDANAFFPEDEANPPTQAQIFAALEGADYEDYIMNSVWEAAPGMNGLFFETQRAAYNARVDVATLDGA